MNQALSTQIPQIGDSSQQLLARIAAAAADQNQKIQEITWLPNASRTTTQTLIVDVPAGVIGIKLFSYVSVVPGVDTLNLVVNDGDADTNIAASGATAAINPIILVLRNNWCYTYPVNTSGGNIGVTNKLKLYAIHSGAGAFIYYVKYVWLKK